MSKRRQIQFCKTERPQFPIPHAFVCRHSRTETVPGRRTTATASHGMLQSNHSAMMKHDNADSIHTGSSPMSAATSRLMLGAAMFLALCSVTDVLAQEAGWVALFDGKSLDGWEKVGKDDSVWEVKDGAISGSGPASMLVCTKGPYKNFRYRAEIKINDGGNSGLYFRTTPKPGFTDGYEAQIDSTHRDPIRTGSLYGFCHVYQQLVKPDTWFTYELEVRDDVWRGRKTTRIKITVDGKELYEYLDFAQTYKEGHFAFQQHDPGSRVSIRKVEVLPLAD
jgi:hypothetical protein